MNNHWALALVKGIREPHEVKKKSFDLGGNRTHDLWITSIIEHFAIASVQVIFGFVDYFRPSEKGIILYG